MLLSFELKVTTVGSFGGHWKGEDKRYVKVMNMKPDEVKKILGSEVSKTFHHDCDDGWAFDVLVSEINSVEKKKLRQHFINGFCGYDKTIDNIIDHQSCN